MSFILSFTIVTRSCPFYTGREIYWASTLPVVSYPSAHSPSVSYDVSHGRLGQRKRNYTTKQSRYFFTKMNVLRTCKLLSRLGQTTVSYFVSLILVTVCFYCSDVPPKDCTLRFTICAMHVIFKFIGDALDLFQLTDARNI